MTDSYYTDQMVDDQEDEFGDDLLDADHSPEPIMGESGDDDRYGEELIVSDVFG